MRVFVTGATGHIGSAVVPELLGGGHEVIGLARSDRSAAALAADGVIHLAYIHDAAIQGLDAAAADLKAIETIGAALEGSYKPFVGTSGTLVLSPGRVGTEDDTPSPDAPAASRIAAEDAVVALAERGIRSSVVRLAPTVHSSRDHHGFIPRLISIARDKGVAAFIADGANRWPAVHTRDAAHLFRLALEAAPAGSRLHGVGDEGVPFRDIAGVIGHHLNLPVVSITSEEAGEHFGWLSAVVMIDNPTSSALTQELLGWRPMHPGLILDLKEGHYFNG